MHLKKLQLHGFKTFAERTLVEFSDGVTAIVGPNGSGKCVIGETLVTLADGRDVPIRELVDAALKDSRRIETLDDGQVSHENPNDVQILSLNPVTLRLETRRVAGFVKRQAPAHLLRVRTRAGREVTATPYHPLFTLTDGTLRALRADEVSVGTHIALPRYLPTKAVQTSAPLAAMLSRLKSDDSVYIPNSPALREWADAVRPRFGTWSAWRQAAGVSATQFSGLLNGQGVSVTALTNLGHVADVPAPFAGQMKSRGTGMMRLPEAMTPDLARFLGLLIAEGRNNTNGIIWFVNSDPAVNAEFTRLAQTLFDVAICPKTYKAGQSDAVDSLIFSQTLSKVLDRFFGFTAGANSFNKQVPSQIFEAAPEIQWAFLSGLFEGDAYLCARPATDGKRATSYIEYATASRTLAQQVVSLLLRLGIFAPLRPKEKYATNTIEKRRRTYYSVYIYGTEQLCRAAERLSFVGDKEQTRQALLALTASSNPNHDIVPDVTSLVREAAKAAGVKVKSVRQGRAKLAAYNEGRCQASRGGLREVIAQIRELGVSPQEASPQLGRLTTLANSDIYWDEVVSVEQVVPPDEWVYDLSVSKTHNFIASNMIVHNSNVGDSILWVLGEQKASAVRGTKAQDVIFSGSDKRKPMGMAEVSLTVDNSDGTLPVEFDEVVITRRAYRSGEGEYFINKVPCRLKDIYELFLDTGVGRESYALVNQSQIDAVLSVNPEDRRGLFEEAAGIKKYRVKKREALRKLEATEANLNRVRDILHEMDGRLEPLRAQAERAERYVALRDRLRAIESNLLIVDLRFADFELTAARTAREQEQAAIAQHGAKIALAERQAQEISQALADAEAKLETARQRHQSALSQAERADSQRLLAAQRAEGLAQSRRLLTLELEELEARRERLVGQVVELRADLTATKAEEVTLRGQVGERQGLLTRLTQEIQDLTRRGEKRRAEAMALARQQASRQAEAARTEARVAELEAGLPSLRQEVERLETAARETGASLEEARTATEMARGALAEAERGVAEAQAAREAARKEIGAAQGRVNDAQSRLIGLRTRLRTLQDLEEAQEGYFAGVKAVFDARKYGKLTGTFTVVADAFQAPAGYEVAFETALAASLQDIITDTEQEAKDAIAFLHDNRAGRATFLPLDRMRPGRDTLDLGRARGMTGVRGAALEIATFETRFRPALEVLLGRVFFCETLDDALKASRAAQGWNRVVTLTGELVLPTGALTGGRQSGRTANILGRKTEISGLQADLEARERDLKECQGELTAAEAARERSEAALSEAQTKRQTAQLAVSEAGRRVEFATNESRRLERARNEAAQRIASSENTLGNARSQAANAQAALATGGAQTADADEALAVEGERIQTLTAERDTLNGDLTGARISLATTTEKAGSLERSLRAAQSEADALGGQQARKQRQAEDAQTEYDALVGHSEQREDEVRRAGVAREAAKSALDDQVAARQGLLQEAQQATTRLRVLGETRAAALETIHKTELREARLGAQRDSLATRLWEDYEISREAALALPQDPEIGDGTPQEVGRLRREIRVMGDVNVGALEEWEQTRMRHEFLTSQRADLDEARAKLTEAIKEIDTSTRGVFLETFQAVSAAFAEIFARLFGGGKTDLILTDPNDILETGVDIMVQPPGKKRQNLALLSGGERALTAAALLFAFLKVKPSPFCVLDEVDAPLDGANVERFADLLREFGQRSQFIIITHNPTTMEAAPIWYGVTMREPGISHVLSMQVPQTEEAEKTPRNGRTAVVQSG